MGQLHALVLSSHDMAALCSPWCDVCNQPCCIMGGILPSCGCMNTVAPVLVPFVTDSERQPNGSPMDT